MDETRREIEAREESYLSVFGRRSARAARMRPLDPEGRLFDYRTEFQRDRDRILHARAFRRLRLKAEGGGSGPSDRRRDRLTHTLEVAQIARTLARALGLNEDLTEAIALGHALGTPPFGRDGERALDVLLRRQRPALPGGFSVPRQSLRVIDLLEKRYDHPGLNLTIEVRAGIAHQGPGIGKPAASGSSGAARPRPARRGAGAGSILSGIDTGSLSGFSFSPEARAVACSDRYASVLGDLDDALRAGEIDLARTEKLPLLKVLLRHLGSRYPAGKPGGVFVKANLIHRGLTHLLVTSTIQHSRKALRSWARKAGIETHDRFLAAEKELPGESIGPDPRTRRLLAGLGEMLDQRLPATAEAAAAASRAAEILGSLFRGYCREPRLLDDYVLLRFKEQSGRPFLRDLPPEAMETEIARRYHASGAFQRLVADHLAGMTDAYASSEYSRLFGPVPSPGGGHPFR